jgi:FKBP12-rapamycin complex-associated protein
VAVYPIDVPLQAEFMEHDEKPLPIDIRLLGALADKVLLSNKQLYSCTALVLAFILKVVLVYFIHLLMVNATFQCHAFAKALHYKEMEFEGSLSKKMDANPVAVVETLIHINNQLHQHEVCFEEELCSTFCTIFQLPLKNFLSCCLSF